jgi:hypothetical protein
VIRAAACSALLAALPFLTACKEVHSMSAMLYAEDQIEFVTASVPEGSSGVTVEVKPMMETAFFLAGAKLEETGGRIRLQLVRCNLGRECKVDVPGVYNPGTPDPVKLVLESADKPVDIVFGDGGEREVYAP